MAYERGATIRAVAAAFGLSFGTARRMLLREGVKLRATGKPPAAED
ncbi:helix-turn-helix domain-containing protein [Amycolatopsis sp. H20-H5]